MNDQENTERSQPNGAASRVGEAGANSTGGLGMEVDRCGLEILERVRDQLAATGKADIAAKIDHAITLIDGGLNRIATMHKGAQIAVSAECDFERGTWTFEIAEGVRVGAGRYALIPMPN